MNRIKDIKKEIMILKKSKVVNGKEERTVNKRSQSNEMTAAAHSQVLLDPQLCPNWCMNLNNPCRNWWN